MNGVWPTAQHLGIDEKTDQAFGLAAGPVGDQTADADIALAAVAMQQALERGQQHHEQRHPLTLSQGLELLTQLAVHLYFQTRPPMAGLGWMRSIGRQFKYRVFFPQVLTPVGQLPRLFAGLEPTAR